MLVFGTSNGYQKEYYVEKLTNLKDGLRANVINGGWTLYWKDGAIYTLSFDELKPGKDEEPALRAELLGQVEIPNEFGHDYEAAFEWFYEHDRTTK